MTRIRSNRLRVAAGLLILAAAGAAALRFGPGLRHPSALDRARAAYAGADWAAASELARGRLVEEPDDRDALRVLARAAARLGRLEAAQAMFARLGDDGAEAEDYAVLGLLQRRFGTEEAAAIAFRGALDRDADHAEAAYELAGLQLDRRRPAEAEPLAGRLARRDGWEARGGWLLGRARLDRGDPAGAAEAWDRAIRLDPNLAGARVDPAAVTLPLARAWLAAGRPDRVRAILDGRADAEARWLLGRAALQEGRFDEAAGLAAEARAAGWNDDPTAAEAAPYVGSASCRGCHAANSASQQSSRHARSLAFGPALLDRPRPEGPVHDPRDARIEHAFAVEDGRLAVEVRRRDGGETDVLRALVVYALGSGDRGATMVAREPSGRARELRLSDYGEAGWDLTLHHPDRHDSLDGYLGRPLSEDSVDACLNCHATTARSIRTGTGPEALDRGIGCETCHGPGGHHLRAVEANWDEPAIAQPRLADAAAVVKLCGRCHEAAAGKSPVDREFIRFQSSTLVQSACYTRSGGGLDCVTCHNPHRDAETDPAYYEAKCLDCHAPPAANPACPVSPAKGCVDCHMPTDPEAVPHTPFTDHHIRIHRRDAAGG